MKKYFISNKFETNEFGDYEEWNLTCYIIYFLLIVAVIYVLSYSGILSGKTKNLSLTIITILVILIILYKIFY